MGQRSTEVHQFVMPAILSNMYMIIERDEAFVVDPNISEEAVTLLENSGVHKITVLLTHEHFDHISGVNRLRETFSCHVMCSEPAADAVTDSSRNFAKFWDAIMMDKPLEEREIGFSVKDENYVCAADEILPPATSWQWHDHAVRVRAAPGHSKGGILVFFDDFLFSGDNLVNGAGVICRLPGGNWKEYERETLPMLAPLSDSMQIYPGHGDPDILKNLRKYLVKFGSESRDAK